MWAIGFKNGFNPAGNDGAQHIEYKQFKRIIQSLECMRRKNDDIYVVGDYTQAMCEMNGQQLLRYCKDHYRIWIHGNAIVQRY